jgi:hypothetical protein
VTHSRVLIPLALSAVLAAGCGSSSDDKTLSKSDYIKQADAICAKDNKKLQAAGEKLGNRPSKQQIAQFAKNDLVPTISSQIQELRALKPPKADQAKLNKLYDEVDRTLASLKSDPAKATRDDPFAHANAGAKAYGLKVCGS